MKRDKPTPKKEKKVYLEILRILAIFGVIFCHTDTYGIHHYMEADNWFNYWLGIFLASVVQFCTCLFFMISGALLLHKEESIPYVYRHRVLKMVLATLLAVLLQYSWNYYFNPEIGMNGKTFFRLFFEGSASSTHWFLYEYLSWLLVLPFLRALVGAVRKDSWFIYLFLLAFVFDAVFPVLAYYQLWGNSALKIPMSGAVVCSIMGYFLEHRCEEFFYKGKNVLIAVLVTAVLIPLNMYLNHVSLADSDIVRFGGIFAWVYAFTLFLTVKYICHRWPAPVVLQKIECFFGAGVFGTYLLEGILRSFFQPVYFYLSTRIYSYPATFVWILVCVLTGCIISNLFKKIPYLGRIL